MNNNQKIRGFATRTQKFNMRPELKSEEQAAPGSVFKTYGRLAKYETDTYTVRMGEETTLSTDASGQINAVISSNPSSSSNWANFANCFDEYRVLGMRVELVPISYHGGNLVTIKAPVVAVVDLDTATALTSYSLAEQYASVTEADGDRRLTIDAVMSGSENSQFVSTGSPTNFYYIKLWSANNTVSLKSFQQKITRIVQFRGKGI